MKIVVHEIPEERGEQPVVYFIDLNKVDPNDKDQVAYKNAIQAALNDPDKLTSVPNNVSSIFGPQTIEKLWVTLPETFDDVRLYVG